MIEWVDKIKRPYEEKNEILYKQYMKELSKEAMPKLEIVENENEEETQEFSSGVNLENTFEEQKNCETESDITSIISNEDDKIYTSEELNDKKMTLTILKTICKNKRIKKYSKLNKSGLIDIILKEQ